MKSNSIPKSPMMSLVCSILGHDYVITTKITSHINEYKCTCCNKEVTNTDKGFLIDLTSKQKDVNRILYSYVQRRRNRTINQLSA